MGRNEKQKNVKVPGRKENLPVVKTPNLEMELHVF
jgi:hypothetical protein